MFCAINFLLGVPDENQGEHTKQKWIKGNSLKPDFAQAYLF